VAEVVVVVVLVVVVFKVQEGELQEATPKVY
jgi:hypothetical protein